ncbi:MAG: hypothetical protein JO046_20375 [Solirubrobacterales bacterium]|nr:hypothetical protein [Solirubrobacterales bacterium]
MASVGLPSSVLDDAQHPPLAAAIARPAQLVEPFGDESPNPLGREVRVLHDRHAGRAQHGARRLVGIAVLGVAKQDHRLLREVEFARINQNLARRRKVLSAALALDTPKPRLERCRA